MKIRKLTRLKTVEQFRHYLAELGVSLPLDENVQSGPTGELGKVLAHTVEVERPEGSPKELPGPAPRAPGRMLASLTPGCPSKAGGPRG